MVEETSPARAPGASSCGAAVSSGTTEGWCGSPHGHGGGSGSGGDAAEKWSDVAMASSSQASPPSGESKSNSISRIKRRGGCGLWQWRGELEVCGLEGLAPHDEGDEEASSTTRSQ